MMMMESWEVEQGSVGARTLFLSFSLFSLFLSLSFFLSFFLSLPVSARRLCLFFFSTDRWFL